MKYLTYAFRLATMSIGLLLSPVEGILGGSVERDLQGGTDLCACSPREYELKFDFSLECDPINIYRESGGVLDAICLVSGFDSIDVADLFPVAASSVQFIEIGQHGAPIAFALETGDFHDGSTITYQSISFARSVTPRAFQVRALGRNAAGVPLALQWAITFSNDCGIFPVLMPNDSIGWTTFVSPQMTNAQLSSCTGFFRFSSHFIDLTQRIWMPVSPYGFPDNFSNNRNPNFLS